MATPLPAYLSQTTADSWRLQVWVQPGAKKSELAGEYQGCLKLRLSAPAVDNKANKALVKYVASLVGLKATQVQLESGHTSRKKTLSLTSDSEPIWERITTANPNR